jgi:hypothetical protein
MVDFPDCIHYLGKSIAEDDNMTKHRIRGNQTVVVSARVSTAIAARLDWIVRNHDAVEDRAEGVKSAVEAWVKAREREAVQQGLFPPNF